MITKSRMFHASLKYEPRLQMKPRETILTTISIVYRYWNMSSATFINYGVSSGNLNGSSIARKRELMTITEIEIVSNKLCIIMS